MNPFELHIPTRLFFGKEKADEFFEQLPTYGSKLLLVIGGGSVRKLGYLDQVKEHLAKKDIELVLFEGIEANPHSETINKAAQIGKSEDVDFVLALGGGSVMDASKAIAGLIHDDLDDIWPYTVGGPKYRQIKGALPVACIPTTAATASEVTAHAVISNPEVKGKSPVSYPFMKPSASWLNPAFHTSLPKTTTRDGASDILSHVFENYLLGGSDSDLADRYSEGVMETVMDTLPKLDLDPENEHLRGQMLWASTMALNGMQIAGREPAPFTLHNLEHALSGQNPDLAHGRGLAILYPAYFRWLLNHDRAVDRMALLAKRLFGISDGSQKENALSFITHFEGWLKQNHLYERLSDQGISPEAFGSVADYAINIYGGGKDELAAAGPLTRENIIEIFEMTEQQKPEAEMA
ncbi:MAG: iron-containing alcohol dehydrogenase [Bacteroidetes bacterium]|jgi:alcohol dehydrogenase YqhD (iron-dependent ADH family)|nr:iron-containing alcohol dehydrogenase [Bacteroidota bacterium]